MTESEWLASTDSIKMFEIFGEPFGAFRLDPRLRRFAVECCKRVRYLLPEEFGAAADAGEAHANDPRNEKNTIGVMAVEAIRGRRRLRPYVGTTSQPQHLAARAAIDTCASTDWHAASLTMRSAACARSENNTRDCDAAETKYQAAILRCLFGPLLFRSILFKPVWLSRDGSIARLAHRIGQDLAFDLLPLLADALQDAGCSDEAILNHCRSHEPHVRGCWVVSALSGCS
jgi:hypothetical protein